MLAPGPPCADDCRSTSRAPVGFAAFIGSINNVTALSCAASCRSADAGSRKDLSLTCSLQHPELPWSAGRVAGLCLIELQPTSVLVLCLALTSSQGHAWPCSTSTTGTRPCHGQHGVRTRVQRPGAVHGRVEPNERVEVAEEWRVYGRPGSPPFQHQEVGWSRSDELQLGQSSPGEFISFNSTGQSAAGRSRLLECETDLW